MAGTAAIRAENHGDAGAFVLVLVPDHEMSGVAVGLFDAVVGSAEGDASWGAAGAGCIANSASNWRSM